MKPQNQKVEFFYLSLLTRDRLKPVSRWEAEFSAPQVAWLKRLGLSIAIVERRTRLGFKRRELVFGRSARWVNFYARHFDGKAIERSPATVRLEGQLFGYPSCCVEHFVRNGYAPNGLPRADQRLLFHWTCPGCHVTPQLLPGYRECYREAVALAGELQLPARRRRRPWLSLAASILMAAAPVYGQSTDPHLQPLPDSLDADHDFLLDRYEETLTQPPLSLSGPELARAIRSAIAALPDRPQPDRPYKTEFLTYGLETCAVCDTTVNMGFVRIVNPALDDSVDVPFIALHALQHGALDYAGTVHWGRVHLLRLLRVLGTPYAVHTLPLGHELDADGDGLLDAAEKRLGLSPSLVDADSDRVVDGPELAVNWAAEIEALPVPTEPPDDQVYRVDHRMRGIETCPICGETVNMGYLEIVNPLENFRVEVPYVALHALKHGSFLYEGNVHGRGQLLPRALNCALHADGSFHQAPVQGDSDKDGLTDAEERTLGLNPGRPDTDGDGVPDGRALAWRLAEALDKLPREPRVDGPYLRDYAQKGLEICDVCGLSVNMGYVRVVNPVLKDSLDVPYVAWHAMRHGAFTAQGSLHTLRVDPLRLSRLLGVKTSTGQGSKPTPQRFGVLEAYPNPFAGETRLQVQLPASRRGEPVEIEIYDLLARRVRTLEARVDDSGTVSLLWDGCDVRGRVLPNGVYFCRVKGKPEVPFRRMLLLR
ncbi:MAG: hypothetical protein GXO73_11855 [Calditrichaeota bacterium]|nr:hypothetical protein [Calditrichota bacterium]